MQRPASLITGQRNTESAGVLDTRRLIAAWKEAYGIDIEPEVGHVAEIRRFRCLDTGLCFFQPDSVAGSAILYARLQKLEWYYMTGKWEHACAHEHIAPGMEVLVVGCGRGDFVHELNRRPHVSAVGLEKNQAAVRRAKLRGWNVHLRGLEDEARAGRSYDVVCHFQVLEHVVDPIRFLELCLSCTTPRGKILASVPNMAGFLEGDCDNLLNQPPHHMTQWYPGTFEALPDYLGVELERLRFEPLAPYHRYWYARIMVQRLASAANLPSSVARAGRFALTQLLRVPVLRQRVTGHTQLAVLRSR